MIVMMIVMVSVMLMCATIMMVMMVDGYHIDGHDVGLRLRYV